MITELFNRFIDLFGHHVVFNTGMLLFVGYFVGQLAEKIKLPSLTGYIIAGLLLGESIIGIVPETTAYRLNSITEIALGLIAITIGAEFDFIRLKKIGKAILTITFFQAIFAFIFVTVFLLLIGIDFCYALILGAIGTATAPAATVIIVKELRARGKFIDYLYGVVAFDDAACVILFSVIFAVVVPILTGTTVESGSGVFIVFFHAIVEIFFSCLLGLTSGIFLHFFTRRKSKLNAILIISTAIIFLTTSIAIILNLSLLIANMILGAVLINLSFKNKRIFSLLEPITPPLFAMFFVLAGTEIEIGVFAKGIVIIYGIVYILSRFAGKYLGTYFSAILMKAGSNIKNYLGFCLFPQAGVAIGLVLFLQTSPMLNSASFMVKESLVLVVNIVLFSIFINELIGPVITKFGITKGAEL